MFVIFLQAIQKAFHCYTPGERRPKLVHLLASFSTFEIFYKVPEESAQVEDMKPSTVPEESAQVEDMKPSTETKVSHFD